MRVCVRVRSRVQNVQSFDVYVSGKYEAFPSHSLRQFGPLSHYSLFRVLIDVWRKSFASHIQMIMWLWSKHLPNNHHNDTVCNSNTHVSTKYMRLNTSFVHTAHTSMRMLPSANNTNVTQILRLHSTHNTHSMFYNVSFRICIPFHTQHKRTQGNPTTTRKKSNG